MNYRTDLAYNMEHTSSNKQEDSMDKVGNLIQRKTSRARFTAKRLGIDVNETGPTLPTIEQEATDSY